MRFVSRLSIRTRLAMLMALAAVAVVVAVVSGTMATRQRMLDDRLDKLRAMVQGTRSYAAGLEGDVAAGKITEAQAIATMRDYAHRLRFDRGDGYVTLSEFSGVTRIHGADPSREGKPSTAADATGRPIADLVADALRGGKDEGVITYTFPKPGQTALLPKMAYVARFEPWKGYFLAGAYTDDLDAEFLAQLQRQGLIGAAILLVMMAAVLLINRNIAALLGRLQTGMTRLASGDLTTEVPCLHRSDELGAMARAMASFKDTIIEAERLRADQDAKKLAAEQERRQAMVDVAARLSASVGGIIEEVATTAAGLQSTAQSMAATSRETMERSGNVAAAAGQAATTVQNVALAAEGLSASISEISQQVAHAGAVIQEGVRQTSRSNEQVQELAGTARKIGDVVKIITDIAGQTNLLALNATIEAARAGDAGKGFAVVASEVKALANQTAKATEEIARQISAVQAATQIAAESIESVTITIGKVSETATAIAAAVEEQGAATSEISRSVNEMARSTGDVSGNIANVNEAARETGAASAQVLASAGELSRNGGRLKTQIENFLSEVRAA